jgi:hypothetical protein
MLVQFTYRGRNYSVRVPEGATDIEVTIPPFGEKDGNGRKPTIVLTDRF